VLRLARALIRLAEADQPVRLNSTTRRFLKEISRIDDYAWILPVAPRLENAQTAMAAANEIRRRDPELDAQLRTTISPDMIHAGSVVNVIPAVAEAHVDIRLLPNESRAEVLSRLRRIVNDNQVEVAFAPGHDIPATEPSSLETMLYRAMEKVLTASAPKARVVPYMQRGATDGPFLRQRGMAVYGVPLFLREDRENRAHGSDERISPGALSAGAELLWRIVAEVAAK
jgi:acetylornithine deacetylase/succinyl-diaminopimelate desuccinylase-like protein